MKRILSVVGARPNFMKIGPVVAALTARGMASPLVHTGQHYDEAMSEQLFRDLRLPTPDVNLEVGSGSHAQQTGEIMRRFEPVMDRMAPDAVLVVGDVNSTIACALVAAKRGVKVIHVEAGLRSYDRTMPEEINRVLTDQISDYLFTTERSAMDNLRREGIDPARVHFVGNVMIDSLLANLERATPAVDTLGGRGPGQGYALVTLHRPSNVDDPVALKRLAGVLEAMAADVAVIFPMHPRTRARLDAEGLLHPLEQAGVVALPPVGYLEMLGLLRDAKLVVTDSGGLQEESTALGVPCLTVRENTERPITIAEGTNTLVGTDSAAIMTAFAEVMATGGKSGRIPEFWDGRTAQRIAEILAAA